VLSAISSVYSSIGNEGLFKVTASCLQCKCGSISETVQVDVIIITDH